MPFAPRFKRILVCLFLTLLLSLVLSGNVFAQSLQTQLSETSKSQTKSKIEGNWSLTLSQRQFQDPFNQRQITEFDLLADLKYYPLEMFYFDLAPVFSYTNGFVQTQKEQSASVTEWGVSEASFNGETKWVKGSLGAINQAPNHPSVLLSEYQTFPAAQADVHTHSDGRWVFGSVAETAIPTTSSLSTQTQEFEKTPSYSSGSMYLKTQKMLVEMELRAGGFRFENLPMSVASKSALLGNTADSTDNGINSKFVYNYEGAFAEFKPKLILSRKWAVGSSIEWVQNSQAPERFNQGLYSKIFTDLQLGRNLQWTPFYEYFRIEPDATVALYNGVDLNTNRVGYRAGLSLEYKKTLRVTLSGGERDAIFTSPTQQREKTLTFKLETLDVPI
jgi:hypothetical protein